MTIGASDSLQQMEKLSSRPINLDGYLCPQQGVQGMVLNFMAAPTRDNYYANQQTIQGLLLYCPINFFFSHKFTKGRSSTAVLTRSEMADNKEEKPIPLLTPYQMGKFHQCSQDRSNGVNQGGPTQRASALAALNSAFNPSTSPKANPAPRSGAGQGSQRAAAVAALSSVLTAEKKRSPDSSPARPGRIPLSGTSSPAAFKTANDSSLVILFDFVGARM